MKIDVLIFLTGAILYPCMEVAWRGYSHYSMAIAGGICLLLINKICCELLANKKTYIKCIVGTLIITSVELLIGIIFNKILLLNVWDYSNVPFNVLGQICLPFSLVWLIITVPAMFVCKKIKYFANYLIRDEIEN